MNTSSKGSSSLINYLTQGLTDNQKLTLKSIAQFQINYFHFLKPDGALENINLLPEFAKDQTFLEKLYFMLNLTRMFDTRAIALQRTGKLGTYPSTLGQEAICVGIGAAMSVKDVLCPYYRETGAQFWRGVKMEEILQYWGGMEIGSNFSAPDVKQDFPISVPIGSQTLHATGVAMAMKLRNEQRAALATIGEGGTSRGDFYESINFAGVNNLPVVYVINNNKWAISVPSNKQTKCSTFAQKAIAGGIDAVQVDGNDIFAVIHAVKSALNKAKAGDGPSVIEAITYRMGDHTTADDASRYRSQSELVENKQFDPIDRLEKYLINNFSFTEDKKHKIFSDIKEQVAKSVDIYLNTKPLEPASMLKNIYATMPASFEDQLAEINQFAK